MAGYSTSPISRSYTTVVFTMIITILHSMLLTVFGWMSKPTSSGVYIPRYLVKVIFLSLSYAIRQFWYRLMSPFIKTHVVRVSEGNLRGREVVSMHTGQKYFSFQGIPYAKPPIGTRRFMPPEPPEPWTGIRSGLYERNFCIQPDIAVGFTEGHEDCLYLNVFTPQLPGVSSGSKRLPVMVWIHGGGYTYGSGNKDVFGPDYLVKQDVILVTLNYRLGVFGFLSLNNEVLPGNAGLKDQSMAFRWVQQNIGAFGGDPNNITLFGESAGSACVNLHMLSPMSKGLFHKVIGQSGSPLNPWSIEKSLRERTLRLAEILGCPSKDEYLMLKFFQSLPARILAQNQFAVLSKEERTRSYLPFIPTLEPQGPGAFISEEPKKLLREGRFVRVPCIFGTTNREGLVFSREMHINEGLKEAIETNLIQILPEIYQGPLQKNPQLKNNFINRLKEVYSNNKDLTNEHIYDLFGDVMILCDIIENMEYYSTTLTNSSPPIYFNLFSFDGSYNFLKILSSLNEFSGACHGDELGYLFTMEIMGFEKLLHNSPEYKIIESMTKWWTNFMKTGNPNSPDELVKWEPLSREKFQYLDIDIQPTMKTDFFTKRMAFWDQIKRELKIGKYEQI